VNVELGDRLTRNARIVMEVFNVFGASASDVDYYYRSRLPGEPAAGVEDIHFHPTLPRTIRIGLMLQF
jgi:hypothetical protein